MTGESDLTTFVTLVTVDDPNVQNLQDLATVWGEIRREFEDVGASVEDAYAVLGEVDFVVVFAAPGQDVAFQTSAILERHGMDTETMVATPTDHFAALVDDV